MTLDDVSVVEGTATATITAHVSNQVTGSPLVITLTNGATITIPVGQTTGVSTAFAVVHNGDDPYVDPESYVVGVTGTPTGGNFEALTTTDTATVSITDDSDPVTATLTASATEIPETGGSITYTVTLTGGPGGIAPLVGQPLTFTLASGDIVTIQPGDTSGSVTHIYTDGDITNQPTITNSITLVQSGGGQYESLLTAGTTSLEVLDVGQLIVGSNEDDTGAGVSGTEDDHVVPNGPDGTDGTIAGTGGDDIVVGDPGGTILTEGSTANIVFVLDTSGSMATDDRIGSMKDAVVQALADLAASGAENVRVHIVRFGTDGETIGTFDLISDGDPSTGVGSELEAATTAVNDLDLTGSTNYEAGLHLAQTWIQGGTVTQTIDVDTLISSPETSGATTRIIGNGSTQIALVSGWTSPGTDDSQLVDVTEGGSGSDDWAVEGGDAENIDVNELLRFDFGAFNDFDGGDAYQNTGGFNGIPVVSATFTLDDNTSGDDTDFTYTIHFTDGATEGPTVHTADGNDEVTLLGTGANAGKQIAYIEFTVASGDTGDVRLNSVGTSQTVTSGTLPNADLNTVVFVSDGAPNYALDDFGNSISTTSQNAIDHILGVDDSSNEVGNIESDGDGPGLDQAFTIHAVGIDLDGGSLAFLANVEGPGNNGATNVTTPAEMTAVIGALSQGQTLADAAGSDVIEANAGSDIIFGDVLFTDGLADDNNLNTNPGSGWAVFQTLEAGGGNDLSWDRDDTIQYIKNNPLALAQESGRDGGDDDITGGAGNDLIYAQEGNDDIHFAVATDGQDIVHGGSEPDGGADVLHLDIGDAGETIYLETVAAYEARTGNSYALPTGGSPAGNLLTGNENEVILVSNADLTAGLGADASHKIYVQMKEIEEVEVTGSTANDTFVVGGSFTGTSLSPSTIYFDGLDGNDVLDISARASGHRVVADGGTHTGGDTVKLDFAYSEITNVVAIAGGFEIYHDGIVDQFTNFESFVFENVTISYADLLAVPPAPSIASVTDDVGTVTGAVANGGVTNDPLLTVRVSLGAGTRAGDSVQLYNNAAVLGLAVVLSQANINAGYIDIVTPALADGSTNALTAKVDGVFAGESAASASHTVTIDTTGPTPSISDDQLGTANIADGDVTFTFQFDQGVTGFDADDISVGDGTKGTFTAVDTDTYTLVVTPNAGLQGDITVNVAAGVVTDAAGNGNAAANALQAVDNVRPDAIIAVADNSLTAGETSLVTITFTEAVTGFTNGDLTVEGGTLSAVSSNDGGITWTATFTPNAPLNDANNVITLNDAGVTDLAGNAGLVTSVSNDYAINTPAPNAAPVGVADTIYTNASSSGSGTVITVQNAWLVANDTDGDGDPLNVASAADGTNVDAGAVTATNTSITVDIGSPELATSRMSPPMTPPIPPARLSRSTAAATTISSPAVLAMTS